MKRIIAPIVGVLLASSIASGQTGLHHTRTVDKDSLDVDFATIQDAINDVEDNPTEHWTILVYAGVYAEAIVLDNTKENVDIVGVDGEAVIIKIGPTDNKDAITIKGTGARNNTIRNLTIITDDDTVAEGRGIVIEKDGTGADPSDVRIIDVTIRCDGDNSDGIHCLDESGVDVIYDNVEIRGVTITCNGTASGGISFAETTTDVTIADTTITTTDGHGIDIEKTGTTVPSNFTLSAVVVSAAGTGRNGLLAKAVDGLNLTACRITAGSDDAISLTASGTKPKNVSLDTVFVDGGDCGIIGGVEGFTVANSTIVGDRGIDLNPVVDGEMVATEVRGAEFGVHLTFAERNVFRSCRIIADNAGTSHTGTIGVRNDTSTKEDPLTMIGCSIEARSSGTARALGLWVDASEVIAIDCDIRAISTYNSNDDVPPAYAVSDSSNGGNAGPGMIIGGSLVARIDPGDNPPNNKWKKQTDVWDIRKKHASVLSISVSDATFSRWFGEVGSVDGQKTLIQRVLNVGEPSVADIATITLTASEQEITSDLTDPDVPRALSVKGSAGGITGDVYIIGTDYGGRRIVEKLTLNGTSEIEGDKPFRTVTEVIVPGFAGTGTVSVGTTSKLGLHFPISGAADVLQLSKLVNNVYTKQEGVGSVDVEFGTVDVSITDGDSFEWTVLVSR